MRVYRENCIFSAVMICDPPETATCYIEVTVAVRDLPADGGVFPAWLVTEISKAIVERYEYRPQKSAAVIAREVFELGSAAAARTNNLIMVDAVSAAWGLRSKVEYRSNQIEV